MFPVIISCSLGHIASTRAAMRSWLCSSWLSSSSSLSSSQFQGGGVADGRRGPCLEPDCPVLAVFLFYVPLFPEQVRFPAEGYVQFIHANLGQVAQSVCGVTGGPDLFRCPDGLGGGIVSLLVRVLFEMDVRPLSWRPGVPPRLPRSPGALPRSGGSAPFFTVGPGFLGHLGHCGCELVGRRRDCGRFQDVRFLVPGVHSVRCGQPIPQPVLLTHFSFPLLPVLFSSAPSATGPSPRLAG